MKTQVLNDLLGSLSIVNYVVAFIFVFIALIIKWIIQTIDSVKNNEETPVKFSWKYWFKDNLVPKILSIILVVLTVFVILRFSSEYFNIIFSYGFAFSIGISIDYWINKIKKMELPKEK